MPKQILVIGLGQFGMSLARSLADLHLDVMAVDIDAERVRKAAEFVADAARLDATDEAALSKLAPERRDVCVCAIGEEAPEAAFICTALLRKMGARRVLARAGDDLYERILGLVGAHQVFNPERAYGRRLALQLVYEGVMEEFPLGDNMVITEVKVPPALVGRSLRELALPVRHGVNVMAIQRGSKIEVPTAATVVGENDVLVTVSRPGDVAQMLKKLS